MLHVQRRVRLWLAVLAVAAIVGWFAEQFRRDVEMQRSRAEALSALRLHPLSIEHHVVSDVPPTWTVVVVPIDGGARRTVLMWHDDAIGSWRVVDAPWLERSGQ